MSTQRHGEQKTEGDDDVDRCSKLAISKRFTAKRDVDLALASARRVKLPELQTFVARLEDPKAVPDWAIGGVVSEKSMLTTSANEPYMRWKLADLAGTVATALVFDDAYKTHFKVQEGDVVLLHKPAILHALERNQGVSLTVRKPGMVLLIGQSRDFGRCRGKVAATGEACKVALDKRSAVDYCTYHLAAALKSFGSSRAALSGMAQPKDTKTAQAKLKPVEKNMSSGTYTVQGATTAKERAIQQEEFERKRALQSASNAAFLKEFMDRNPGQRNQVPAYLRAMCADPSEPPAPAAPTFDSATIRRIGYNPSTGILAKPSDDHTTPKLGRGFAPGTDLILGSNLASKKKLADMIKAGVFLPAKSVAVPTQEELQLREARALNAATPDGENTPPTPAPTPTPASTPAPAPAPLSTAAAVKRPAAAAAAEPARKRPHTDDPASSARAAKRPLEQSAAPVEEPAAKKKPESLAELLGRSITKDSAEGRKVLSSGGHLGAEAKQLLAKEQETHFARLGKLEAMSSKLQTTYEITVKAIHCKECGLLTETTQEPCRRAGHTLTPQSAKKRFFKCNNCSHRTDTLEIAPTAACDKCGVRDYSRCGMRDDAKGPDLLKLLPRGEEHSFALGH